MDISKTLDQLIGAYTKVTEVRAAKDVAKYQASAATQQAMFNSPTGYGAAEALATGNARVNGAVPMGASASMQIPKELIYGGLGLAAVFVAWKVLK